MKRRITFLLAALLLLSGLSWAQQITWSAADQGYENGVVIESVDFNDYVAGEFFKGTNNNAPKYYTTGAAIRCYGGNYFTITSDYVLTEISFGFASGEGSNAITSNVGTYEDGTWTGSANEVTFTISGTSGHRRFATFTITYDEGGNPAPSITANNVEIAYDATEGAIEYTITNGVEGGVLSAATEAEWLTIGIVGETVPFTCSVNPDGERTATVTLTYTYDTDQTVTKNVTVTQANNPNAPGTENNPYTVAQARAAIDAGTGTQGVYATGIVSAIPTAYNPTYSNVTFNMVDEEGDEVFLQAYRCGGDEAANVAIGDVVVVYGNLIKYNTTYEFAQGCQVVSLEHPVVTEPSITVNPSSVNVDADEHEGTLALAYQNLTITEMGDFDIQYYDAEGTELEEGPEWIEVLVAEQDPTIGEGYVVSYYMIANDGEARSAYLKVYAMDAESNLVYSNPITINQEAYVAPTYAALPFEFNGGKADIENTDGLYQEGLGSDYGSAPKLKFDGTGDYLLLQFNERPDTLTFIIKGNSFSGGTFTVQTSEDGETYDDLAEYTELGATQSEKFAINSDVRYIKWVYTNKSNGNVGLGNITLSKPEEAPAVVTVSPDMVTVPYTGGTDEFTVITENINNQYGAQIRFYDPANPENEIDAPEWIANYITYNYEMITLGYDIPASDSYEARTACFKYAIMCNSTLVFSNLITITQEGPAITIDPTLYIVDEIGYFGSIDVDYNFNETNPAIQLYDANGEEVGPEYYEDWISINVDYEDNTVVNYSYEDNNNSEPRYAYFKVYAGIQGMQSGESVYSDLITIKQTGSTSSTGTIYFGNATGSTNINSASVTGDDNLGNTWTITTEGTTSFTPNTNYSQVGSSNKPASSITFTTTLPQEANITAFSAKFGGFSGTQGNISLKVDGEEVGLGSLNGTTDITVESAQWVSGTTLTVTVTDIAKGVKCYYISYTYALYPSITVDADQIEVADTGKDDYVAVSYRLLDINDASDFGIQFYNAEGEALGAEYEPDWITLEVTTQPEMEGYFVHYTINENLGAARTAYFSLYAMDDEEPVYSNLVTVSQAKYELPAAELPFEFDGGRADIETTIGLFQEGLDSDYGSSPKLKFNTTGDWVLLHFNERPDTLAFYIKGNSFSGSTFKVQTSEDGETYIDLKTYTDDNIITGTIQDEEFTNLDENIRYIKWIYTEKVSGNVALGNIRLAKYTEPVLVASITVTPDEVNVDAAEHDGTLDIAFENLTITSMEDFDIQYYDVEGQETEEPAWIEVLVAKQDSNIGEGYVVSYSMLENEGEARTAYFKVFAINGEEFVYSNLVTVNQEAYVAPSSDENYVLFSGDLVEGDYVIYYNGYAMKNVVENSRLSYSTVTPTEDVITNPASDIVWHIAPYGEYWTIYNAELDQFAASTGAKNKAQLMESGSDDKALWTVTDSEGTYEFVNKKNSDNNVNANLRNNGEYGFACYASTTGGALSLYKCSTPVSTFTKEITGYGDNEGGYYLIASPVVATAPSADNGFLTNAYDLYKFDQTKVGEEWYNYETNAFNLTAGKGYLYASQESTTLTFMGIPYSGDGIIQLSFDADHTWGDENYYWNLVGNPFGDTAYIDRPFYAMNETGTEIMSTASQGAVAAMQGVFVLATEDGETLTFTTEEAPEAAANVTLNLSQNRGAVIDRTIVRFGEGRQLPKFQLNTESTKLYIPQGNNDYAVVRSAAYGEMPVNFKAQNNGTYTISVNAENAEANYLHLIDNMTGNDIDLLATPSYSFEAKTTDYASRFRLVFNITGVEENTNSTEPFAFFNGSEWVISNIGKATLQMVDLTGRILSSESISGNATVSTANLSTGIYLMRLVNGENVKTQKIVVK